MLTANTRFPVTLRRRIKRLAIFLIPVLAYGIFGLPASQAESPRINLADFEIVDLTHTFDKNTVFWPTSPIHFEHDTIAYGETDGGYFYSAYTLHLPEHGGTHMDAPIHFSSNGVTADKVAIDRLLGDCVVIDTSKQASADSDYRLTMEDVAAFEATHGQIGPDSIVLMRTDWSKRWPNVKAYLGDDTPGDASHLSFPSFGAEATEFLIDERGVKAVGVDTASIDYGQSKDFLVHRILADKNIPAFENLTNLDRLPAKGAFLIALPMKIGAGSGGPLRAIALIPRQ